MAITVIYTALIAASILCALILGRGAELSAAVLDGAQSGVSLALSLAGSVCLWSGVGALMKEVGILSMLTRLFRPVMFALFPSSRKNHRLALHLSGNICANLLGLGNAATPMGIQAARQMARGNTASNELCRLIVLNTASIQLIPANIAAVRSGLGCLTPFDILPAVWCTSLCSVSAGLVMAWILERVMK